MFYCINFTGDGMKASRFRAILGTSLMAIVANLLLPSALIYEAQAVNIILNFESGKSDDAADAFDPNGVALQEMFEIAESFYQDVFEDSYDLTINYWYDTLSDADGTLGLHSLLKQSDGREVKAKIRIDSTDGGSPRNWFVDSTPDDHSEFSLTQQFFENLSSTEQTDFFNFSSAGNIPGKFEVGYLGSAASSTSTAASGHDMLSVVLHEVGHALGMASANKSTKNETDDGDYDFNSDFIFGQTLAVETANDSGDDNEDISHLEIVRAMMTPGISMGMRMLPSHTDLFAMAAAHSYVDIDVPRREMYGGTNWNTNDNWSGDKVPGSADDAFVRHDGNVTLNDDGSANDLFVGSSTSSTLTTVTTNNNRLWARGVIILGQPKNNAVSGLAGRGTINVGGSGSGTPKLVASQIMVNDGSSLSLTDSDALVDAEEITIEPGGELNGHGTVDVLMQLTNNGQIIADGNLAFTSFTPANVFNLDGVDSEGLGNIDASDGSITFENGNIVDPFGGTITIGEGHNVDIDNSDGFVLGNNGVLVLSGGASSFMPSYTKGPQASLSGSVIDIRGYVDVTGNTRIEADTIIFSDDDTKDAQVWAVQADDRLTLVSDDIQFEGGQYKGTGVMTQSGDATVYADTTIDIDRYDMDGNSDDAMTTILPGVILTINSNIVDYREIPFLYETPGFDGILNVVGGTADINTNDTWDLDGELILQHNSTDPVPTLASSSHHVAVSVSGNIKVAGSGSDRIGRIESPIEFTSTGSVSLISDRYTLELNGSTTLAGAELGTLSGSSPDFGTIVQNGDLSVTADSIIEMGIYDWDGNDSANLSTTTVSSGVTLSIKADGIGPSGSGNQYAGTLNLHGATLVMDIPASQWELTGQVNLAESDGIRPSITGIDLVTDGGDIYGSGSIDVPATFSSGATIEVSTGGSIELNEVVTYDGARFIGLGTLEQNADATVTGSTTIAVETFDWDGMGSADTTIPLGQVLTIQVPYLEDFNSTLDIDHGELAITVDTAWRMDGTLNLTGSGIQYGRLVNAGGTSTMQVGGTINISGNTYIAVPIQLDHTATVSLPNSSDNLTLGGESTFSGGTFSGDGLLIQNSTATIDATTLVDLGVYDMDGADEDTSIDVENGAFQVKVNTIDDGSNIFDGKLNIAASQKAEIQTSAGTWTLGMAGQINLVGPTTAGTPPAILAGSNLEVVGQINAEGLTQITTPFELLFSGELDAVSSDTWVDVSGHSRISGGKMIGDGTVGLNGGSTLSGFGNIESDFHNSGIVSPGPTAADILVMKNNHVTGPGDFTGPGTIVCDGCLWDIGTSPAQINVTNLEFTSDSTLRIEIGGSTPGTGYDQLNVSGKLTLDGTLELVLINGFSPSGDDTFDIIFLDEGGTGAMSDGVFSAVQGAFLTSGLTIAPVFGDADSVLTLKAAVAGDADFDGHVDIADLGIVGANFNADVMQWNTGDFNLDGTTDVSDLGILGANWTAAQAAGTAAALVPEPATLALLGMSVLMVVRRW